MENKKNIDESELIDLTPLYMPKHIGGRELYTALDKETRDIYLVSTRFCFASKEECIRIGTPLQSLTFERWFNHNSFYDVDFGKRCAESGAENVLKMFDEMMKKENYCVDGRCTNTAQDMTNCKNSRCLEGVCVYLEMGHMCSGFDENGK